MAVGDYDGLAREAAASFRTVEKQDHTLSALKVALGKSYAYFKRHSHEPEARALMLEIDELWRQADTDDAWPHTAIAEMTQLPAPEARLS